MRKFSSLFGLIARRGFFYVVVSFHVLLQITRSGESFVAQIALKWFLIGMNYHMFLERSGLMETLATLVALVRPLACVDSPVS